MSASARCDACRPVSAMLRPEKSLIARSPPGWSHRLVDDAQHRGAVGDRLAVAARRVAVELDLTHGRERLAGGDLTTTQHVAVRAGDSVDFLGQLEERDPVLVEDAAPR